MRAPETIDADPVTLRRWHPQWAGRAHAAIHESLPELRPWMPWAAGDYTLADAIAYVERATDGWNAGTHYGYAIFAPDGELIGSIGLMTRMGPGTLEVGYWLRTAYTGKGYTTAAVKAVTKVALRMRPGVRVLLGHDAANLASAAVARKAGFAEYERVTETPESPGETGETVYREYRPTGWERVRNRIARPR